MTTQPTWPDYAFPSLRQTTTRLAVAWQGEPSPTPQDAPGRTLTGQEAQCGGALAEGPQWLIWSVDHGKWWGPSGYGYVSSRHRAGRYSLAEAVAACMDCHRLNQPRDTMVPE
jgi:hypothetical protein